MNFPFITILFAVFGLSVGQSKPWEPQAKDDNWLKRHEALVNQTLEHGVNEKIVFIGDSITEGWLTDGKAVWEKYYTPRHAYNYGIGGDRTENVLYRIENKEFDGLKPNATILMIGTNNIPANTVEDIAHGIKEIVTRLKVKMPTTKIIVLGILPKSEQYRPLAKEVNALIEDLADNKTVFWLDMWTAFADAKDNEMPGLYKNDSVHLVEKGYEVWQAVMERQLNKLIPSIPWVSQPRDADWMKKHERMVNQTVQHIGDEKITFVGDSITEGWLTDGKAVWDKFYAPKHAYNYGIGGDATQHVLYRIENKEFEGLKSNVAVVMIGTNNIGYNSAEDITHGVKDIVTGLETKIPTAKIILLGVLPRPEHLVPKVKELNVLLEKLSDNKTVFWLDMWTAFADNNGTEISGLFKDDNSHLVEKGYQVWHDTLDPLLKELDANY